MINWLNRRNAKKSTDEPTIFHITHYKSGSQWVYAVLREVVKPRIVEPEVAARHVTERPIIEGAVYPCVYLSRQAFLKANPPKRYRAFIVMRDLRDTLVSQYFSVRYSHPMLNTAQEKLRDELSSMSLSDGLIHLMEKRLMVSARIQQSWMNTDALTLRYEDLNANEYACFKKITAYCNIDIGEKDLEKAVALHSFEKRAGRKPGQEDINSHYRKGIVGDWRNHFDEKVTEIFKQRFGEILILSGYEKDFNW